MVQRCGNLVDLDKCCKMSMYLKRLVPIQPRRSPLKFDHLIEKFGVKYDCVSFNLGLRRHNGVPLRVLSPFRHEVGFGYRGAVHRKEAAGSRASERAEEHHGIRVVRRREQARPPRVFPNRGARRCSMMVQRHAHRRGAGPGGATGRRFAGGGSDGGSGGEASFWVGPGVLYATQGHRGAI